MHLRLEDWIAIYDNAIPSEFCEQYITLFEDDNIQKGGHNEYWRRCKELSVIDSTHLWEPLKVFIRQNYDRYKREHPGGILNAANTLEAPNMFRYDVDSEKPNIFNNHADAWNIPTSTRQLSVIIYLNDVEEGGETRFVDLNINVKPKKGRILFFPSFFNYVHRGEAPVSNSKYIIVSWIHFDGQGHAYRVHKF